LFQVTRSWPRFTTLAPRRFGTARTGAGIDDDELLLEDQPSGPNIARFDRADERRRLFAASNEIGGR